MTEQEAQHCRARAENAERMAMVAIEMVLTLGAELGKQFDLAAYAEAIDGAPGDDEQGRRQLADMLRKLAA